MLIRAESPAVIQAGFPRQVFLAHVADHGSPVPDPGHLDTGLFHERAHPGSGTVTIERGQGFGNVLGGEGLGEQPLHPAPGKSQGGKGAVPDIIGRRWMNVTHAQLVHALLQQFARPAHEFLIALVKHVQQGGHLAKVNPGEGFIVFADVAGVVDEIRQLDGLGVCRSRRQVIPVHGLAHGPVAIAGLADVRKLVNQPGHPGAEGFLDVVMGGRGVLHGVVQPGGGNHFLAASDFLDQVGDGFQVHLVGLLTVLAPVVDALVGAGGENPGAFDEIGHEFPGR